MEIKYTSKAKAFEKYANECLSGHEGSVIHTAEKPCIWTGLLDTYDKAEAKRRNLDIGIGQYYAGTIVCMPEDVSVCITTWGKCDKGRLICDKVAEILSKRGICVSRDQNDILADGKKVASYCSVSQASGWVQTVVHLSVGKMNLDLVKAICTKPMEKIPGALSDYGITTDELKALVEKVINEEA